MRRSFSFIATLSGFLMLMAAGFCQEVGPTSAKASFLGLYFQGQKVGYAKYATSPSEFNGQPATKSESLTVMGAGMLGQALQIEISSVSFLDSKGRPFWMEMKTSSAGRIQKITAVFGPKTVRLAMDNSGQKSEKTIDIPDGDITDDAVNLILQDGIIPGQKRSFWVLDSTTASFIKNEVRVAGPSTISALGKTFSGTKVQIIDPRITLDIFVDPKGELVYVDSTMGISMVPESEEEATVSRPGYSPTVDLALATKLVPDKPLKNPNSISRLRLKITGPDLSRLPQSAHQSSKKDGDGWIVDVKPVRLDASEGLPIAKLAPLQPKWLAPDTYIPSSEPAMIKLAKQKIGTAKTARTAAVNIKNYVEQTMRPNAGIGVLRDAREVLSSREGVCRDYAILTATLLRAGGIPTKLVSGLVNWDGEFYYHAWVEFFDGARWVALDSTTPQHQVSACHVKLAEGTVASIFTFPMLGKAKIEVLLTERK